MDAFTLEGARKGATTQDISFPLAIAIEHAQQQGQEVAGLLLDRLKCFDRLCRNITLACRDELDALSDWLRRAPSSMRTSNDTSR